mmetsp:Transcript_28193/g.31675  ORF Transcript_28193/g.31675 Transcript_28193/m.31675 type:complete len:92 (-) Transcript_28193:846-1121(-)
MCRQNLGAYTRAKNSDLDPPGGESDRLCATFWMTQPYPHIILEISPLGQNRGAGLAMNAGVTTKQLAFGLFETNTSHLNWRNGVVFIRVDI